jgi:hypothetical protein
MILIWENSIMQVNREIFSSEDEKYQDMKSKNNLRSFDWEKPIIS